MKKEHPSVFISYSWDSIEHEDWVSALAIKLRENEIDAIIDKFETQLNTVNLNRMMTQNIQYCDNVIVVLTENYKIKADTFQGGVGYETNILIRYILDNPDKLILVMRSNGAHENAVPFYLNGYNYIDFSRDNQFDSKFNELLNRIKKQDIITIPEVNEKQQIKKKEINFEHTDNEILSIIPNTKQITDKDINKFMMQSYNDILSILSDFAEQTKQKNDNFDYDKEIIHNQKSVMRFYINGMEKYAIKIWLDNILVSRNKKIGLSYGTFSIDNNNSFNDLIECEVSQNNDLKLKMSFNYSSDKANDTAYGIAVTIWSKIIQSFRY